MTDEKSVLEQNIRLHQIEAYFYNAIHPEDFNLWEQRRLKREIKQLSAKIDRSLPVMDLASGTGNLSDHLRKEGVRVIACDLSREMLKENRAQDRVQCDATRLPFKDGCFSAITGYSMLHHLPDPCRTMKEVTRVAVPKECFLYFDHDHFLPEKHKSLGHYDFSISDLAGWVLWITMRPRYIGRLFKYALWGRRKHLQNMADMDVVESHERVNTEYLFDILDNSGFDAQIVAYNSGSFLEASRTN